MAKSFFIDNQLRQYAGDKRLFQYLTYKKEGSFKCVYCLNKADSKEHIPSKIFLDEPYNNELAILPACKKCNQSFSEPEQYLACLIEYIKIKLSKKNTYSRKKVSKALQNRKTLLKELEESTIRNEKNEIEFIEYKIDEIEKIILKLSIGHAAYSLSEINLKKLQHINFKFLPDLTQEEINTFNTSPQENIVPEIGSREGSYISISDTNIPFYQWKHIQKNQYRYLAFISKNTICVRIVISEFFFSEVIWDI